MKNKTSFNLVVKQNILKNIVVVSLSIVMSLWVYPYVKDVGERGVDIFLFLSIFPLGAMFGYFAFSYSSTNLDSIEHRTLADITTLIFLLIICFSISFAAMVGVVSVPQLKFPFIVLSTFLIAGCLAYDFWDLYSNLKKDE